LRRAGESDSGDPANPGTDSKRPDSARLAGCSVSNRFVGSFAGWLSAAQSTNAVIRPQRAPPLGEALTEAMRSVGGCYRSRTAPSRSQLKIHNGCAIRHRRYVKLRISHAPLPMRGLREGELKMRRFIFLALAPLVIAAPVGAAGPGSGVGGPGYGVGEPGYGVGGPGYGVGEPGYGGGGPGYRAGGAGQGKGGRRVGADGSGAGKGGPSAGGGAPGAGIRGPGVGAGGRGPGKR